MHPQFKPHEFHVQRYLNSYFTRESFFLRFLFLKEEVLCLVRFMRKKELLTEKGAKLPMLYFFFLTIGKKTVFLFRVVSMDFYGRNDITLGGFLERFCFRWVSLSKD